MLGEPISWAEAHALAMRVASDADYRLQRERDEESAMMFPDAPERQSSHSEEMAYRRGFWQALQAMLDLGPGFSVENGEQIAYQMRQSPKPITDYMDEFKRRMRAPALPRRADHPR